MNYWGAAFLYGLIGVVLGALAGAALTIKKPVRRNNTEAGKRNLYIESLAQTLEVSKHD